MVFLSTSGLNICITGSTLLENDQVLRAKIRKLYKEKCHGNDNVLCIYEIFPLGKVVKREAESAFIYALFHRIHTAQEYAWKYITSRWNTKVISIPLVGINALKGLPCPFRSLMWSKQHWSASAWNLGWKGSCFIFLVTIPEKHWMQWAEKDISFQVTFSKEMSQLNKYALKPLRIVSITESKWRSKLLENCWLMAKVNTGAEKRNKGWTANLILELWSRNYWSQVTNDRVGTKKVPQNNKLISHYMIFSSLIMKDK